MCLTALLAGMLTSLAAHAEPTALSTYNPRWSTPGPDASASMPIGNGELGLNVWTEPNADLSFYLSRTDAWSEASRLMKLGRVRVTFDPPLAGPGRTFSQELDLQRGVIRISTRAGGDSATVEIFVHPEMDVAYVVGNMHTARRVAVTLETWRTERTRLTGAGPDAELTSSWTMHDAPESVEVWESADLIFDAPTTISWGHRNEDSIVPFSLKHQGLESVQAQATDPLLHRTFGGQITALPAASFTRISPTRFESTGGISLFCIKIATHSAQNDSLDAWRTELDTVSTNAPEHALALEQTAQWWSDFWTRSYIFVEGDQAPAIPLNAHPIRFGTDAAGGNRFRGEVNRAGAYPTPYDDGHIQRLARGRLDQPPPFPRERALSFVSTAQPGDEAPNSAGMAFPNGFTLEAVLKPDADLQAARILDKVTPGQPDGFLFDIQPGGTLRLVVGDRTLTAPGSVKLNDWNRVAATFDPATERMRLFVGGRQVATTPARDPLPGSPVTRAYILQRWITACAGRGAYPIKFNGSIFTVDAAFTNDKNTSPDYRRWGDCHWWQNLRLPYHPMLAGGDFEMMDPLFRMYTAALPISAARAKLYHNVQGAYFPETMSIFGLYSNGDYGWDRAGHDASEVLCPWWRWAWNQGTELVALMLDRYDYTGDEAFAREQIVPMADQVLRYFDTRFKRDDAGKLLVTPTQALETHWHDVTNDMPVVAGLHDITARLLALPPSIGAPSDRELWQRLHAALPPLPKRVADDGVTLYAPAAKYQATRQNIETPELYHVFPHRLIGVDSTSADLDTARETYRRRHDKATNGWTQDGQFASFLGMTDEAKANLLAKVRNSNPRHRFPAIWGPNFDWLPDQTHGGNLMFLTQTMLLQPRGKKLLLLPAWPRDWNVSFKLHAPEQTIVECDYRNGKIVSLTVTPESRRNDVQVMIEGALDP